ncbi:MAG TPA: hypothetical protein VFM05_04390, partial [Candidatus Saccharimonadales bacterium]|nr:hypothetical protein [Candidatus Saccharimonadales bacterium]
MSEGVKRNVDTSSAQFKEGVKAGLNSTADTKNWQAGIELGQELKDEGENKEPVSEILFKEPQLRFLLEIARAMTEAPRMRRMKRKNKF